MLDIGLFGVPAPVALAVVAAVGYLVGRRQRRAAAATGGAAPAELERAKQIVRQLEQVSQRVRRGLATHHASVRRFKDRMAALSGQRDAAAWRELSAEVERVLQPTLDLSQQIATAYDEFRRHAGSLMSLAQVRLDPLTGLRQRDALDAALREQFALAARYGVVFSLAIVAIDGFEELNRRLGRRRADQLLQQVAHLIQEAARETDVVVRFGGEEFALLMPETNLAGAVRLSQRLRRMAAERLEARVSVGVAEALDGDTPKTLLTRADSALFTAKSLGRDCVCRHTGVRVERAPDAEDGGEAEPAAAGVGAS